MKIWIIPMKGKGWEVTARNLVCGETQEEARPLTTDPFDNVLFYGEDNTHIGGYAQGRNYSD